MTGASENARNTRTAVQSSHGGPLARGHQRIIKYTGTQQRPTSTEAWAAVNDTMQVSLNNVTVMIRLSSITQQLLLGSDGEDILLGVAKIQTVSTKPARAGLAVVPKSVVYLPQIAMQQSR